MKKVLPIFIILLSSCGAFQIKYTPVSVDPVSKDLTIDKKSNELFVIANEWMIDRFNNPESVIEYTDKEEGILAGKYLFHRITGVGMNDVPAAATNLFAVIKIQVKDGATRITISPQTYNNVDSPYIKKYTKEMALADINLIIENYIDYVKNYNDEF